jgi:HAD superfamily hydrolase (TIGR01509 family)
VIKTIIFDMDGVIVDSEYTFLESKTQMLQSYGYDKGMDYQYQFMGTTFEFMWTKMKQELELPNSVEDYIVEMNQRRQRMIAKDGVQAIPHVKALIQELFEEKFQLVVASSSPKKEIESNLEALGLINYFSYLISGEEVEYSKPAPDIFLKAAKLTNTASEQCLVFEDTTNGTKAAKAAKMMCIGFSNPDYPEQELYADKIIHDFREINAYKIKNWKK